ncbi:MAG: hypothetical protein ACREGI_00755, partial [Candidatus Levyibacteriota bacterium]
MKKIFSFHIFAIGVITVLIITVFRTWFLPGVIAGGDLPYYFSLYIHGISFLSSWSIQNMGMGSSMLPTLWLQMYTMATLKIFSFLPWDVYVRIVWLFPYLLFLIVSSYFLGKYYFKNGFFYLLTPFLYVCNTYALLLVGGGQMGIALSYALVPFGILAFENFLKKLTVKSAILFSFAFSLIFLMDIRIAYILIWLLGVRFLFELPLVTKEKVKKHFLLVLSGVIIGGLHAFWLLPTLFTHGSALKQFGDIFTSSGAVKFFSFAKFENTLGLLHPNWPENIFGLTHFMQPEFLLLPILAFGSLLFIKPFNKLREKNMRLLRPALVGLAMTNENIYVLFFALLGLIGVFLAKGANAPFGNVYLWLFNHVPGFIMFRDPTKWYLLIVVSYSMLIPFTVGKVYERLKNYKFTIFNLQLVIKSKIFNIQNAFVAVTLTYLLFLIKPAILGQLSGTLRQHSIPQEYNKLQEFLASKNRFSRTLWVPVVDRFGFISNSHPAVSAEDFFHVASVSAVIDRLDEETTGKLLEEAAVQYIIVPYDSEKEIFLKDRKYDNTQYLQTISHMQKIKWLHEVSGFGRIRVFQLYNPSDHFWLTGQG